MLKFLQKTWDHQRFAVIQNSIHFFVVVVVLLMGCMWMHLCPMMLFHAIGIEKGVSLKMCLQHLPLTCSSVMSWVGERAVQLMDKFGMMWDTMILQSLQEHTILQMPVSQHATLCLPILWGEISSQGVGVSITEVGTINSHMYDALTLIIISLSKDQEITRMSVYYLFCVFHFFQGAGSCISFISFISFVFFIWENLLKNGNHRAHF